MEVKNKKIIRIILVSCTIVILVILVMSYGVILYFWLFRNFPVFRIDYNQTVEIFTKDYNELSIIADYCINTGHSMIIIRKSTEMWAGLENGHLEIEDPKVRDAIKVLSRRGYRVISREDQTISFLRWSNLDNGRGIAYTIDGSEPILQFLTRVEPLPEPGWYYYEEDFNEWRIRNR